MAERPGDRVPGGHRKNNNSLTENIVMKRETRFLIGLAAAAVTFGSLYVFAPEKMGAGGRHCFGHGRHAFYKENNERHLHSQEQSEGAEKPARTE